MPIYEYQCTECLTIFDVLVRSVSAEATPQGCPRCSGEHLTRRISRVNVIGTTRRAYSDEFIGNALPFLRRQPETARLFAEGKGSDDSKAFEITQHIGRKIDQRLEREIPGGDDR